MTCADATLKTILPSSFTLLRSVHIAERTQAEPVAARRINIPIDGDMGLARRHLERFSDLSVQLEVGDGTPVLWRRLTRQPLLLLLVGHFGLHCRPCGVENISQRTTSGLARNLTIGLVDGSSIGWLHGLRIRQCV